jgi:hypothetical protein
MNKDHTHESGAYSGDPNVEILERMRRLETRVTNSMRGVGLMPSARTHDPLNGVAALQDGVIYVTSPEVSLAEVSKLAVRSATLGRDTTFSIVLCNQPWGAIVVRGERA